MRLLDYLQVLHKNHKSIDFTNVPTLILSLVLKFRLGYLKALDMYAFYI